MAKQSMLSVHSWSFNEVLELPWHPLGVAKLPAPSRHRHTQPTSIFCWIVKTRLFISNGMENIFTALMSYDILDQTPIIGPKTEYYLSQNNFRGESEKRNPGRLISFLHVFVLEAAAPSSSAFWNAWGREKEKVSLQFLGGEGVRYSWKSEQAARGPVPHHHQSASAMKARSWPEDSKQTRGGGGGGNRPATTVLGTRSRLEHWANGVFLARLSLRPAWFPAWMTKSGGMFLHLPPSWLQPIREPDVNTMPPGGRHIAHSDWAVRQHYKDKWILCVALRGWKRGGAENATPATQKCLPCPALLLSKGWRWIWSVAACWDIVDAITLAMRLPVRTFCTLSSSLPKWSTKMPLWVGTKSFYVKRGAVLIHL